MASQIPEVWLRGALPGINAYLQPVAHALLQAREELTTIMKDFPGECLWEQPAGRASVGFHLQHLSGVLDRLFTYAKAEMLSPQQLDELKQEGIKESALTTETLLKKLEVQVTKSLEQLKITDEKTLNDFRGVGRAQLPSTVLGLLFHAAEHTMRHVGQLLVTVEVIKQTKN